MSDWVALTTKFTPGWPWPESSWGLDPRFGPDGWCRACGTPLHEQTGPLTIQGSKFPTADVWMPNWSFDVVCVSAAVAETVSAGYRVRLSAVHQPRTGSTGVKQLIPEVTSTNWYDAALLKAVIPGKHPHDDAAGSTCPSCARWRWLPLLEGDVPIRSAALARVRSDVISSPEWFGSGWSSMRHLLFRRALAEVLVGANPKHWSIVEVELA